MVRKLIVEVVDARNLMPKDGHGTSSPYVQVDYYGQRKRTKTAICELNPTWNEVLEFNVAKPSDAQVLGDMLEVVIYHDKNHGPTTRNNFLGWICLNSTQLFVKKGEEALIYFPLQKKSLLSWIQGDIGLKIYYVDHDENEVAPPPPPPEPEKKQEEPPAVAAPAPPPEPAPAPPAADGEKPNEEPPAAAAEAESAAAPPPENAEAEPEKPTESSQPPPQPTVEESTPPEVDSSTVGGVEEPTPPDDPVIEMMPASVSKSMPEVRIAGPQPIKRPFTGHGSNFTPLDPTESMTIEKSSFDLVEKMHYLFVQVVKARKLPSIVNPIVRIGVSGGHNAQSNPARKSPNFFFEWDQTFAFGRNSPDSSSTLEVSVWDSVHNTFLGGICFDVTEIPLRDPPDSPLAPQWYRLDGNETHYPGELMLATWIGTQADEAFPDATKSTDCRNNVNSRAKVYQSPKLWYLRATVIEARDILDLPLKDLSFQIKAQLGIFQVLKTKVSVTRDGSPLWNEDLLFIAAEPFSDYLVFFLEMRQSSKAPPVTIGIVRIPNAAIERRVDDRKVASHWYC